MVLDGRGLALAHIDDDIPTDSTPIVFSRPVLRPSNTAGPVRPSGTDGVIVGTPQQTQYGVRFTALLDPAVIVKYPAQLVKNDNSQIVMLKKDINAKETPVLDKTGTYIVMGARYFGDSRGTPWYVEIDGFTSEVGSGRRNT